MVFSILLLLQNLHGEMAGKVVSTWNVLGIRKFGIHEKISTTAESCENQFPTTTRGRPFRVVLGQLRKGRLIRSRLVCSSWWIREESFAVQSAACCGNLTFFINGQEDVSSNRDQS